MLGERLIVPILLIWFLATVGIGCDKDKGVDPPIGFQGITVTDSDGNVITEDPDDWCDPGEGSQYFGILPAYPNPVPPNATVAIELSVPSEPGQAILWIEDYDGNIITTLKEATTKVPKPYLDGFSWDARSPEGVQVHPGVYRLFLEAGPVRCHGDIQIEAGRSDDSFEGITEIDPEGNISSVDPDDWRGQHTFSSGTILIQPDTLSLCCHSTSTYVTRSCSFLNISPAPVSIEYASAWPTISVHPASFTAQPGENINIDITYTPTATESMLLDLAFMLSPSGENVTIPAWCEVYDECSHHSSYVNHLAPSKPNPFSSSLYLSFQMAQADSVTILVMSPGEVVIKTLIDRPVSAGENSIIWDGTDNHGHRVTPGIYRITMQTGSYSSHGDVKKLLVWEK